MASGPIKRQSSPAALKRGRSTATTLAFQFATQLQNSYSAPGNGNELDYVPKIGNMREACMMLIGVACLTDYVAGCPQASPALRALNALIRQAAWTKHEDLSRSCGAVMRIDGDSIVFLELGEAGCEVALKINYDLGVVRVIAVRNLRGEQNA
jgi:mRNA-degrading endonuclease HigB of HigAB toxin-antitoxin module